MAVNSTFGERAVTESPGNVVPLDELPAFSSLYQQHVGRALGLAGLLCGEHDEPDDVVAEAFVKVLSPWRKGRVEAFWPYLRVAIVNELRGRARRRSVAARWRERTAPALEAGPHDDEVAERVRLAAALHALPERQRHAVVLRYFEDLSEVDAAELMGCSVGTVKSNAFRGAARLRQELQAEDDR